MTQRRRILITGAAGRVARLLVPTLREHFQLRLLDLSPLHAEADDEIVQADLRDVASATAACSDVSAVVHLAAQPAEAEFREKLLPRNVDATWAMFAAAVSARVPRLIFASTLQVVQGYDADDVVPAAAAPRPISVYACTKVFGEALGRLHADTSGLGVACLRIGAVRASTAEDLASDPSLRALWCGSEDLARLVVASIRSTCRYAIVTAVSPPATSRFDTSNPFGWTPVQTPDCDRGSAIRGAD